MALATKPVCPRAAGVCLLELQLVVLLAHLQLVLVLRLERLLEDRTDI
jgi:hypothetical protein